MVEKQLTKAISKNETVQFRVKILGSAPALEAPISYSWYSLGSPKAKICLEDDFKIIAPLDTGAEINIIIKKLMKEANLAMRKRPKLELVSHTGQSQLFLRFCEYVEIAIGRLKTKHPIFVIEAGDHDLVLGQLFLNFVKFNWEYKPDGIFSTITHPYMYQIAVFCTLAPQDLTNQKENQIFPQFLILLDSLHRV